MSETVNQETATNEQSKGNPSEKLFTQDQVNEFFNKRYSELMSQVNEYKDKAMKFDEIEEANKTELQKANERAEKLQTELDSIKKAQSLREMRERVAKEAGVPLNSMSLINGETEEACKEQAKTILSMLTPASYPQVPDGGEVHNVGNATAKELFAQFAAQAMNS